MSPTGSATLEARAVGRRYGGLQAVADVSMTVHQGEIVGILGANGAGKTTLFNILSGAVRASSGDVLLNGRTITRLAPHRRLRMGIARTFQLIQPFTSMTVFENVLVSALGSGAKRSVALDRSEAVLQRLGMASLGPKPARDVNAVEGKRLEVARALVTEPTFVLLDEIFAGLNSEETEDLIQIVRSIRDGGVTVLIIEHSIHAIRQLADRVIGMESGRVISEGTPDEVLADPAFVESYLGRRASTSSNEPLGL
jgi:branched-chain amino acid transport system ATP-binding protein